MNYYIHNNMLWYNIEDKLFPMTLSITVPCYINECSQEIDPLTFDFNNANIKLNGIRIIKVYEDNDEGTNKANQYMHENQTAGVLTCAKGLIILADINDKGC